jgi:hypothetical protein
MPEIPEIDAIAGEKSSLVNHFTGPPDPNDPNKPVDKKTPKCHGCGSYHGPVNDKLNCVVRHLAAARSKLAELEGHNERLRTLIKGTMAEKYAELEQRLARSETRANELQIALDMANRDLANYSLKQRGVGK